IRRVERKFGQKSFTARVAGRDLPKLYEVALPDGGILVDALEMRRVPAADEIEFGGPARRLPVHTLYGVNKGGPILRCGRRWCEFAQPAHWVALLGHSVEDACGGGRPGAGQKLDHAESRDAVARVFSPAQEREHVFDVRGLKKFQAAELHEWNVAPSQFHLERAAVIGGAEQNGLRFECEPRLPVFQDLLDNIPCLIRFIAHADQLGPLGGVALRPKVLSKALFGEIDHGVCRRQDWSRGTIILIKRDDFRRGIELTGEVENISHRRSAERINRLRVISNHSEAPTVRL